ncbi:MAG TPA: hypothetical protein VGC87_03375 [Pyrinomonadaceae bacterium]|jgi:hypothetical protein
MRENQSADATASAASCYEMYKKYLEEIVGWELPLDIGPAAIIRFGPDWEPKFYELSGTQLPFVSRKKK